MSVSLMSCVAAADGAYFFVTDPGHVYCAEEIKGQWKTADFKLSEPRFINRTNGSDLRLAVTGGDMELAVRRVELRKAQ